MSEVKNVCFLCGEEGKPGLDLSEYIEGTGNYACYECLAAAAINEYSGAHKKKSIFAVKLNWGFWLLIATFIAFIITWFVVKPRWGVP